MLKTPTSSLHSLLHVWATLSVRSLSEMEEKERLMLCILVGILTLRVLQHSQLRVICFPPPINFKVYFQFTASEDINSPVLYSIGNMQFGSLLLYSRVEGLCVKAYLTETINSYIGTYL